MDLMVMSDRLRAGVATKFGAGEVVRREWSVGLKRGNGTQMAGSADLLVETAGALAVVDHKSYGVKKATEKAGELAGQMGVYAEAAARELGSHDVTMWVHLPLAGVVAEVVG